MEPRTLEQIQQALDTEIANVIDNPSQSQTAEWLNWRNIFAPAIWVFEKIMAQFSQEVDSKLALKQPGSLYWYAQRAMEFQYGDSLIIDELGNIKYAIIDPSKRIIAKVATKEESATSTVVIKVARLVNGVLSPLSSAQLLAFNNYITLIKFAGTKVTIVSLATDEIYYSLRIYYNPLYNEADIEAGLLSALEEFKNQAQFDGRIYRTDFFTKIQAVPGIVATSIREFTGDHSSVNNPVEIDPYYELVSGYFSYSETSKYTLYINE